MDCLIINIATATGRMVFMARQMDALGLAFRRVEAVTPDRLSGSGDTRYWDSWERPLRDTEKACFLSHVAAWRQVAAGDGPALILEDDALLSRATPDVLKACETLSGVDHLTLEVRKRKKIVSTAGQALTGRHRLLRLYQDRSGAAAYVLWPAGARKLLHRAQTQAALADALICQAHDLTSFQVEPACAVQLDRAAAYGIAVAASTKSQIDAGAPAPQTRSLRFRIRRITAQLRMGLRAIRQGAHARRRQIRLDPRDFPVPDPGPQA